MPAKNDTDLEPLLNAQQNHLSLIMSESSSTDAKALGIGAANIAVLIFIAQASLDFSSWLAHASLLVPFVLALACNTMAILPYRYVGPGVDTELYPDHLTMDRDTQVKQLLSNTQSAIKTNDRLNKLRWKYCAASLACSTIGTAVLFVIL